MAHQAKPPKDYTGLVIAIVFHVILIGGLGFWAYKSGKLEQLRQAVLQYVRSEKKGEKKAEPVQHKTAPTKLPPINQGLPPAPSSGSRRAVAADAPSAAGETFFQDTRQQVQGPGSEGGTGAAAAAKPPPPAPKIIPLPPPVVFKPPPPSTIRSLLQERATSLGSIEAIGTEQIGKSGSSDAGAVVNRVAGASIVDGKFAVIRGLSDRYVTTTLNGAEIPSADPYRRSASLDLFPAQVIEKVVVSKTFTPDKPGAYTGGGIDITTKCFPDKPFLTFSLGTAYNSQATGNDKFLTYDGGGQDWLGMDDGTRELPSSVGSASIPNPIYNTGRPTSPTFQSRVDQANLLNDLTRAMGTAQFAPVQEAPPLDHNFFLAAGDKTHLLGRPAGVFGSFSYKHEYRSYDEGIRRRELPKAGGGTIVSQDFEDSRSLDVVNWSAMASAASEWSENHQAGFNFFYNQASEKSARIQVGTKEANPGETYYSYRLQWVERNLQTYQLKGTDEFPHLGGTRLDWLVAMSSVSQDEPDTRFFNMLTLDGIDFETGDNTLPEPADPTRYYRQLGENNLNPKVDLTIPFRAFADGEAELKLGWYDSSTDRDYEERQILYRGTAPFNGDPNTYLTPDNLGYTARPGSFGSTNYTWNRYISSFDSTYTADSHISAQYLMLEVPLFGGLKLVGGARFESTDIQVDSESYIENAVTGQRVNSSKIKQTDVLPAVSLIHVLRPNMNLRLSYSETVARPSFRELAACRSYDPILDVELDGNPNLKMTSAKNYDARWEWFPRPGELISVSLFYKDLKQPIERRFISLVGDLITYDNRPEGEVWGVELELRKNLDFLDARLRGWSLGGNLSLMQSETPLTDDEYENKSQFVPGTDSARPLYDQSPYLANVDVNYDNPRWGTSASLVFGIAGPRIAIASLTTEDVYEQPAPQLDFILSQKLARRMTLKFTAKNLLNPKSELTYGQNGGGLYSSYGRGMTFGLSLTCGF
jgi:outer membrane receptor protein involved in Fe transport